MSHRTALIRLMLAAILGAVLAFVLLAVISRINADGGFSLATVASTRGWTISALAGLISAVLAWMLLLPRHASGGHGMRCHPKCPICGGAIGGDWRLCPHCGEIIG